MKTYYFASPTAEATKLGSTGRLFKKQVLPLGDWVDPLFPEDRMTFTRDFLERMVENHKASVAGRIAAPSFHTDDSQYNKGEVVDLELADDGLYAYLDIRDDETAASIEKDTIWDVSAKFTDNYQDTKSGTWFGPTLLHVALVNNPYIKKMNPFKALAESLHQEHGSTVRALSESQNTTEEHMTKLVNSRDFPVVITLSEGEEEKEVTLQPNEEFEVAEDQAEAVSTQIDDAVAPETEEEKAAREAEEAAELERQNEVAKKDNGEDLAGESDIPPSGEGTEQVLSESQRELADARRAAADSEHKLAMRDIEDSYKQLLSEGRIVPAMEQPFKALSEAVMGQSRELSDGKTVSLSESLAAFMSAMPKIVALDEEAGKTDVENHEKSPWSHLTDAQRERLQASGIAEDQYNKTGGSNGFSAADLIKNKEQ